MSSTTAFLEMKSLFQLLFSFTSLMTDTIPETQQQTKSPSCPEEDCDLYRETNLICPYTHEFIHTPMNLLKK